METSDSDCVSDLLAPVLVRPFLCSFNFPNISFSKEREGEEELYYVGGFFCYWGGAVCVCDLDRLIERCDMLKMELREQERHQRRAGGERGKNRR